MEDFDRFADLGNMLTRTETSSEVIAGHGDPIDDFVPVQRWHLFFLVVACSALSRDEIIILGPVRLAPLSFFPHF